LFLKIRITQKINKYKNIWHGSPKTVGVITKDGYKTIAKRSFALYGLVILIYNLASLFSIKQDESKLNRKTFTSDVNRFSWLSYYL
jgi:hypothetical protein